MSATSNYYRVTPQILIEYVTDQYKIIRGINDHADKQPEKYFIYKGLDGGLYYTEKPRYTDPNSQDYFKNQSLYQKYPDVSKSQYKYLGINTPIEDVMNYKRTECIQHATTIVKKNSGLDYDVNNGCQLSPNIFYDRINIYFLRGFYLDQLDGFGIQVKTTATYPVEDDDRTYTNEIDLTLLDFYLAKENFWGATINNEQITSSSLKPMLHFLDSPLYLNSKFYDKYITVEFPSAYALGISDYNWDYKNPSSNDIEDFTIVTVEDGEYRYYDINPNSNPIIEFETVSEGNSSKESIIVNGSNRDAVNLIFDPIDSCAVQTSTNTDYFNVRIYEDSEDKSIVYYPVYGDVNSSQELDAAIMGQIEAGIIPMSTNSFYDLGSTVDNINDIDFGGDRQYYSNDDDSRVTKWKVYSDLNVTYANTTADPSNPIVYDENYSRIIDYSHNANTGIKFWRSRFVPNTDVIRKLNADTIYIKYTCRLVNVVRGVECIRIASLTIDDLSKYVDSITNYLNVNTYKIVNKINQTRQAIVTQPETVKEKYIRSYYNATNLVAKNLGTGSNIYNQGQMTLYLNRTNNNYMIQLFNISADNVRIPYDLTGPYKYKMVFPIGDGSNTLSIKPNSDSTHQNLGIGTLVFYITGEQANQIMNVPDSVRYFSIMTDVSGTSAQETVLYEGKVNWLT